MRATGCKNRRERTLSLLLLLIEAQLNKCWSLDPSSIMPCQLVVGRLAKIRNLQR